MAGNHTPTRVQQRSSAACTPHCLVRLDLLLRLLHRDVSSQRKRPLSDRDELVRYALPSRARGFFFIRPEFPTALSGVSKLATSLSVSPRFLRAHADEIVIRHVAYIRHYIVC